MFSSINTVLICFTVIVIHFGTCTIDIPQPPSLTIYTPSSELDYTDVIVKRVNDNLTLVCELQGDVSPRVYVWNFVGADRRAQPFQVHESGPAPSSTLSKQALQLADSGHYMCSVPPFSVSKYILVQTRGPQQCARGAFWCGAHCVLAAYVCDGFRDCLRGEDEAPSLCDFQPCARPDKLNCSSGRCVSEAACCRSRGPLCRQPACCDEHPRYSRLEGLDAEYPPLFEDRHAPDDYGFIQSTIYTVTACALIFMIAVVLLVSAICKMHMKRAALRSYTRAHNHTSQHYSVHYAQAHRFPPCYEASRLLEQGRTSPLETGAAAPSPGGSPTHQPLQCSTECPPESPDPDPGTDCPSGGFGLARLSAMLTSRYRQVPTQCLDVEMTDVRSASLQSSPTRNQTRTRLDNYRSPTYCDLNADFIFTNPDTPDCGRDLNYMATPVEFYRRRTLRGNLDRVLDNLNRPRPLTLQLGRFQLSIPRLGRRASLDRRPDTPNVAELNIDELDFVRLNSNETYTLNGRTIRLLGGNFENYPILNDSSTRPPPYTEAMRYKLYGPPPEYLSRDGLNDRDSNIVSPEQQARNNIEMPPNYDELASGVNNNITVIDNGNGLSSSATENAVNNNTSDNNVGGNNAANNINNVTGTQVTALNNSNNGTGMLVTAPNNTNNGTSTQVTALNNTNNVTGTQVTALNNTNHVISTQGTTLNNTNNVTATQVSASNNTNNVTGTQITAEINLNNGNEDVPLSNCMETLLSGTVIDNLPAIDSDVDVNANDNDIRVVN